MVSLPHRDYRLHPHATNSAVKRGIGGKAVLAALVFGTESRGYGGRFLLTVDEDAERVAAGLGLDISGYSGVTLVVNERERLVITCYVRCGRGRAPGGEPGADEHRARCLEGAGKCS